MSKFLLRLLFGVIALAAWGVGGRWAWGSWDLSQHSVVVDGRVVSLVPSKTTRREDRRDITSTNYTPIVEYEASGTSYRIVARVTDQVQVPSVGATMRVRYRSEHPEEAVVDGFSEMWLMPSILGGVGLLAVLALFAVGAPPQNHARYVPYAEKVPSAPPSAKSAPYSPGAAKAKRRIRRSTFTLPDE